MTHITHRSVRNRRALLAAAIEPLERRMLLTSVIVNTTADSTDAPTSTVVSLRDAISIANASTSATTITFNPTVFATAKTITLGGTDLNLKATMPVTITGPAAGVTINGNQESGDIQIDKGAVSLSNMTFTGGKAGVGAAIQINGGSVNLTDCTVSGNSGGGIDNPTAGAASMTLTGCTVSGNSAPVSGGGIANTGPATLTDCTISGNKGGGFFNSATATLSDCTISGNTATAGYPGGGIFDDGSGITTLANTIVAGNSASAGADVDGPFISRGFNLIGKTDGSTGWTSSDLTGTSAKPLNADLGALANHGGRTQTMLLEIGSPAIDHGSNALIPNGITTDQRGYLRIANGIVDIGALEVQDTSVISGTVFHDANGSGARDADEEGLANWTVYLDLNNNGQRDPGEPFAVTDSTGHYSIGGLAPGDYTVRIVPKSGYKQTTPATAIQTILGTERSATGPTFGEVPIGPYGGTPAPFGLIQAENFDLGGQNTGYFNPDNANRGGLYRPSEGVGIGAIPEADGGGYFVGWTLPGETLNYTVSVATTATYTLGFRVACLAKGGTFHLNVDGKDITDELSIPATGSYDVYTVVSEAGITLTAGTHVLQLVIDSPGTGIDAAGNFDWIQAIKTGPPNLLVNGNFSQGATGFSSQYPNSGTAGGGYLVDPNPSAVFDHSWVDIGDHTTGLGLMLLADASTTANQYVWEETVGVTANTTYSFAGWAADMHKLDTDVPDLAVYVNNVQIGTTFAVPSNPGGIWSSFGATWKSGSSKTATIKIVDLDTQFAGNDFALDDLSFSL